MSVFAVKCKLCGTPLNNKKEFIGHHMHSHEWSLEQASTAWHLTTTEELKSNVSKMGGRKSAR